MNKGILYLVPTPIGNLADITLRALDILRSVKLIAAEDTRQTGILLKHYDISTKQISYHKYNEKARITKIIQILEEGEDIAVVTDAGSPGISDPSSFIVNAAISSGIKVVALPGATALIPALTASGLDSGSFVFYGFLPAKKSVRERVLIDICKSEKTCVLYETCPKLYNTLKELLDVCGNRQICIAREISKIYEEYIRGDFTSIIENQDIVLKGELVLIIAGAQSKQVNFEEIDYTINMMIGERKKTGEILEHITGVFQIRKNDAYERILALKKERSK